MIKNFFKAICLGMKEVEDTILSLLITYFQCMALPTLVLIILAKSNTKIDGIGLLMLILFLVYLNVVLTSFFKHCIDACKYAHDNAVDIKVAFELTRHDDVDNSDDPM